MLVRTRLFKNNAEDNTLSVISAIGYADLTENEISILKEYNKDLNVFDVTTMISSIETIKEQFKEKVNLLINVFLKTNFDAFFSESEIGYTFAIKERKTNRVFKIKAETLMGCTQFTIHCNGQLLGYLDPKDRDLDRTILKQMSLCSQNPLRTKRTAI